MDKDRRDAGPPTPGGLRLVDELMARSVFDALPAHIALLDREGRILATNRAWRDFALENGGDMLRVNDGANYLEACEQAPADQSAETKPAAAIREVLAGRRPGFSFEYTCHSETEERWFLCRVLPFAGGDNRARAIIVHDNVTSVHVVLAKAAARERMLQEKLEQSARLEALGRLTGGMAHDFNNFLGIIMGNLDLLSGLNPSGAGAELIDAALRAALNGAAVIESLLALAQRQPTSLRLTDINRNIDAVAQIVPRVLGSDIRLETRLGTDLAAVRLDVAQFNSSLINLARNARDAMPDGGVFTIATRQVRLAPDDAAAPAGAIPGDYVLVEVTDTGVGMPPDVIARVFEPFYTTKGLGQGTGLGLSMVYGWITQAGGHIVVQSEVGKGTTFRLYLPRAAEDDAAEIDPATPTGEPIGGTESVLVVDDNAALRETLCRQLEHLGYSVSVAGSGAEALDILEGRDALPKLLLSDVVMPGQLNGLDLAELVRRRWPAIRILLTSGHTDSTQSKQAARLGAFAMLRKPYRRDELARALRAVLTAPSSVTSL